MDIFKLLGTLWGEHERAHLNKSAIILYFFLLYEANQNFWKGPLVLSWEYLGRVLGVSSETLGRAISDLKSRGLITYSRQGKHSYFWFPDYFDFQSKNINHFDNRSGNRSENRSDNRSDDQSKKNILIHEHMNTSNSREFPYGNSATLVANEPPKWYLDLDDREKDIVDTWRTLIGPFDPKWLPLMAQVLQECYPAQIKNAIVSLAKTKADVMKEQGFEYVVEPLLKGMFGKRKRQQKPSTGFSSKLTGLKQFLGG